MTQDTTTENRRHDPRIAMDETVTIRFDGATVVGPGKNISSQGLFFIATTAIPVSVRISGVDGPVRGELVRVEAMAEGQLGIAVRFLAPAPELPPA